MNKNREYLGFHGLKKNQFSEIQWRQITGLRHVLVHEYFGVDSKLIWQIIADDIPELKIKIKEVLLSFIE